MVIGCVLSCEVADAKTISLLFKLLLISAVLLPTVPLLRLCVFILILCVFALNSVCRDLTEVVAYGHIYLFNLIWVAQ